jgi:hypothetical protein
VENLSPNIFPTFVIFEKKLPKVNNRPKGETLPNLVTLLIRQPAAYLNGSRYGPGK